PSRPDSAYTTLFRSEAAGAIPVPLTETLCGLPDALSVITTLAARLPVADGEKLTEIAQFAPAARVEPTGQVLVCAKSAALVPASERLRSDIDAGHVE